MYNYEIEKLKLDTAEGKHVFYHVKETIKNLLSLAGAVRMEEALNKISGDSWTQIACMDRLVELGELKEITDGHDACDQDRVFVSTQ